MVRSAKDFDLVVVHTSMPSFESDVKTIEALKDANPNLKAGLIGAKVAVNAGPAALTRRPSSTSSRATSSTSPSRKSPTGSAGRRSRASAIATPTAPSSTIDDRPILQDMDDLPFVTPVYKRDLEIENYFIGYLKHPYISIYTGRGCKSRCTFCLWPQTVGGHRYRTRSVGHVIEEIKYGEAGVPAGEGILLRRRHVHRRSAARGGDRE